MLEVIKFELKYRLRRPATYIYFVLLFAISVFVVSSDAVRAGGSGGQLMDNAPTVITSLMLALSWLALLICSAVMAVPVLRDYEHSSAPIIFTTSLKKWQYLFGRFFGSYIILVMIGMGILLGMSVGQSIPWPWVDTGKMLPFNFFNYLQPFILFVIPNLFIFGAIFFTGGTLGKKMTVVYALAVILFMGYLVTQQLLSELDNRNLAGILDPFGIGAYTVHIQYWTVAEQNSQLVPFAGIVATNRLIWLAIGLFFLGFTFFRFNFDAVGTRKKAGKKASAVDMISKIQDVLIPKVTPNFDLKATLIQIKELSIFYFKWMIKQVPFIFIVLAGVMFLFIIQFTANSGGYDISTYSTTSSILQLISIFNVFFIILIVFYTGELVWKERDVKINLIYDTLPFPDFVSLTSKYIGFFLVHVFLLVVLIVVGILIQLIQGYDIIELDLYFKTLFTDTLMLMALYTFLGFFIQAVVNHKFVGFAIMVVFYLSFLVLGQLGVEHNMFYFARAELGQYSEMNKYGHFVSPFSWFNVYWTGLALVLFGVAVLFANRGTEVLLKTRFKLAKMRFTRPILIFLFSSILLFGSSGFYIYYNTNIVNQYRNSNDAQSIQAQYERDLKQYELTPQPKIVDTKLEVDIFPKNRDFATKGYYMLKNKTESPMSEIHIQKGGDFQFDTKIDFGASAELKEEFENYNYHIYQLKKPLQPGEEIKMSFETSFVTNGFVEGGSNTSVIYNGTFFNNSYFPSIGYNTGFELASDDDRKDNDLEPKERMLPRDDPRGLKQSLFGDDADKIKFEITISTDSNQIAIAPGYLQKKWAEGDRVYYHYKMDVPMVNFYSIISADYEVKRDVWHPPVDTLPDVNLEIYYHKGHEYNLDRMMRGMKKSLSYYTENFSPYQFRQLRIMEFPRYASFAQSFANTVPFSEGIGFIQKINEDDVDLPFYVTAHEVAHQWWGHQVTEAGVQGNAMLSETMSQYSALMVMKQEMPPEQIKRFLRYELNSYLFGRTFEQKKEKPIELVESQGYIHYRKGSLLMYALQDYISEDSVNMALKRFNKDWAFKEGIYPTSKDLLGYFRRVTPDSLQYVIDDMFENITLFENKVTNATYEELDGDKYKIDLTVNTIKYRADSLGNETAMELKDWIDIGVFGEDENGEEKLIYLKKHKINKEENTIVIEVDQKPIKAGIDPINKLIDRNPDDNTKAVGEKEPAT